MSSGGVRGDKRRDEGWRSKGRFIEERVRESSESSRQRGFKRDEEDTGKAGSQWEKD